LSAGTVKRLEEQLQTRSALANPLALPADITAKNWGTALTTVLADNRTENVLTVCSPSPFAPSTEVAEAICEVSRETECNVFTCWVGGAAMLEAQKIAAAHGVLSHESPEKAIAVFLGAVSYRHNRELLMQMPPSLAEGFAPDVDTARSTLGEALAAGSRTLSPRQARRVLQAYGLAVGEYPLAGSIDRAIATADEIGYPVDLFLMLANGAELAERVPGLRSPAEIGIAARGLRSRARSRHPGDRVSGYRLRPSAARSGAPAMRLGVADDPVFGPVIFLGPALTTGFREDRMVVALPPLNPVLAGDLVARSGFAEGLPESDRPALQAAASNALVRLSQLLTDLDEVAGVELDPLHIEASGVVVLGARISIEQRGRKLGFRRFAIRPYPKELERQVDWEGRTLLIRPIRPEDETQLGELLNSLTPEDSRMRFFDTTRNLPRTRLARFSQIDYDREMALLAIERGSDGAEHALGEVRAVAEPGSTFADFAIVVASGIKGRGLGQLLLQSLVSYCRNRGIGELRGETLDSNLRMQHLAQKLGFTVTTGADRGTLDLRLLLNLHDKP
jgi:acetyltransferase